MQAVFEVARSAAASNSTVLLLGESGTGKELLARAIHVESPRADGAFVAVSCAALTETLLESELFGHEKGAFTGATATRKGKVELAQGGTLFLDEIGDISPKLQLDLLRVLEQHEFRRVGGTEVIRVDARVIAATNRDLRQAVADGHFREDLFYRLNVIPIVLPPLRDRTEDIPLLVEHFLDQLRAETGKAVEGVTRDALGALMARPWPGNVRELRNVLERGVVLARDPYITAADLELMAAPGASGEESVSLREAERRHIETVLARCGGNVTRAARALGIDRVTLHRKIEKYGIRPAAAS
jgi:transcriptional regulator with PAS, ATPase and Fis domain